MYSSMSCAWTGILFQLGTIAAAIWVLLRVIWLHVRVCWDHTPGKIYMLASIISTIVVPVILLGVTIAVSGFSFRTGPTCSINQENSFAVFWGWIIGIACLSFAVQAATSVYCLRIYIRSHRSLSDSNSSMGKSRSITRQRWRHIQTMFLLQWRSIALSILVVVESIYFAAVYWAEDKKFVSAGSNPKVQEFGLCLITHGGDKTKCTDAAKGLMLSPTYILASMIIAAVSVPTTRTLLAPLC
jgi:hypothetical protein